jgi:DNA-binding transcriptional ArsR family regulator
MARLLYYVEEHVRFREYYDEKLTTGLATLFFEKLKAHYKFGQCLEFRGFGNGSNCSSYRIRLGRDTNVGTLAHEVAHAIQFRKIRLGVAVNTRRWHTKKHTRIMENVLKYISNNRVSWIAMQDAKNERSVVSYHLKKEKEVKEKEFKKSDEYKLGLLRASEKRLSTKAKRIDTLLKKVKKKIKYYLNKKVSLVIDEKA